MTEALAASFPSTSSLAPALGDRGWNPRSASSNCAMSVSHGDVGAWVRRTGRRLCAIAAAARGVSALAGGGVAFVLLVATAAPALAAQDEPDQARTGAVVQEADVPVEDLEVGDCFLDSGSTETAIELVRVVPCSLLHDNEVFHKFDLPTGTFPVEEKLERLAHIGCVEGFEGYVGETYDESPLEIQTLTPTEESWAAGDREVICTAYEPADAVAPNREAEEVESPSAPLVAAMLVVAVALVALVGAAMWRIFTKAGEAGWKALIPVWNLIVLVRMAGRPRWWLLLLVVPVVNIVIVFPIFIALARAFGKGAGFGVGLALLGLVFFPILAFGKAQYNGGGIGPRSSVA